MKRLLDLSLYFLESRIWNKPSSALSAIFHGRVFLAVEVGLIVYTAAMFDMFPTADPFRHSFGSGIPAGERSRNALSKIGNVNSQTPPSFHVSSNPARMRDHNLHSDTLLISVFRWIRGRVREEGRHQSRSFMDEADGDSLISYRLRDGWRSAHGSSRFRHGSKSSAYFQKKTLFLAVFA